MFLILMAVTYTLVISIASPDKENKYSFLGVTIVCGCSFALIADSAHKVTKEVNILFFIF